MGREKWTGLRSKAQNVGNDLSFAAGEDIEQKHPPGGICYKFAQNHLSVYSRGQILHYFYGQKHITFFQ